MTTFTSLLVATDFSVDGNNAVRRAALLAHEHGAGLRILHVLKAAGCQPLRDWFSPTIDIDLKAAQSREALRRVAVEISSAYDLTARVEVVVGDPFEALLQASQSADLVVLGQRGHSRLEALRVGGTVDRMLRTCRRPVLVVKTPATQPYCRILVPIDFTAYSEAAIEVAARLRRGAGMHVFHAFKSQREAVLRDAGVPEHIIRETRLMEEAGIDARMRRRVAKLGLDGMSMSFAPTQGPAVRSTLLHAQAIGADLIVAGKRGRSTLGEFLLGSVSRRVLYGSGCDVLIVPRPQGAPAPSAATERVPRVVSEARPDNAALARTAAEHGAASSASWIYNTARFMPRRSS